jgi:hypothetical protein
MKLISRVVLLVFFFKIAMALVDASRNKPDRKPLFEGNLFNF